MNIKTIECVCRTCLNIIRDTDKIVVLNKENQELINNREKLTKCIPELTVDIVLDPMLCHTCKTSLESFYHFRTICLETEKTLYKYIQQRKRNATCTDLLTQNDLIGIARKYVTEEHNYSYIEKPQVIDDDHSDIDISDNIKNSLNNFIEESKIEDVKPNIKPSPELESVVKQKNTKSNRKQRVKVIIGSRKKKTFKIKLRKPTKPKVVKLENTSSVEDDNTTDVPNKVVQVTNPPNSQSNIKVENNKRFNKQPIKLEKIMSEKLLSLGNSNISKDVQNSVEKTKIRQKRKQDKPRKNPRFVTIESKQQNGDEPGTNISMTENKENSQNYCDNSTTSDVSTESLNGKQENEESESITETQSDAASILTTNDTNSRTVSYNKYRKRLYECTKCDKAYSYKCHFDVHLKSHIFKKLYSCPLCEKSFTQEKYLEAHAYTHATKTIYQCEICSKYLKASTALQRHILIHTGEKPFKCTVCPKRFNQNIQLTVHMRTHTGFKPFICDTCGTSFTQKSHLIGHVRTHTGEKPYFCGVCPKRFRKNNALIVHSQSHSAKRFQCDGCYMLFRDSSSLKKHVEKKLNKCNQGRKDNKDLEELKNITALEHHDLLKLLMKIKKRKQANQKVTDFYCKICKRYYASSSTYRRHLKIHKKIKSK